MAVFPDRIVLKNSTDSQAAIEAAIQAGGTDEITQGEVVLGINTTSVQLYAKAGDGSIVTIDGGAQSINDLTDVDTSTTAPVDGQALVWDNAGGKWIPGDVASSGGGGSGATRTSDSGTAASGELTLTGLGSSGQLHTLSTDLDAWVVFYGSAADRTADAGRSYSTDPTPGSGVLAEAYVTTSGAILFTPGTGYMNNDTTETAALYLAVRDQTGAAVNATLTVTAYVSGGYTGATVRAALGIGEYADDAAAGTGGVASGAMYYNTTSADYRLKT